MNNEQIIIHSSVFMNHLLCTRNSVITETLKGLQMTYSEASCIVLGSALVKLHLKCTIVKDTNADVDS